MTMPSDERLDQEVARYLDWRGGLLQGAPDAATMAATVAARPAALASDRPRMSAGAVLLVAGALLALAVGTAAVIGARSAIPAVSPGVLVIRAVGESAELQLDPATGEVAPLRLCDGTCPDATFATWSGDGRWMAFLSPTDHLPRAGVVLRVYDAQTETIETIWTGDSLERWLVGRPAISPDGTRIAVADHERIVTMDLRGGDVRVISPELGMLFDVSWLADGRVVTYGGGAWPETARLIGAVAVDPATGAVERLPVPQPGGYALATPDGTRLVVLTRHPFTYFTGPDGIPALVSEAMLDVWTMATDGTDVRHLPITGAGQHVDALLAPDGRSLAALRSPQVTGDPAVLTIIDLESGEVVLERDSPVPIPLLSWAPVDLD